MSTNKAKAEAFIKDVLKASGDSHDIFTPFELCDEVVSKIPSLEGNILVVANLEFVYTILMRGIDRNRVFFATPNEMKARAAKQMQIGGVYKYNNVITSEDVGNMKFDVVVGNPPYQSETVGNDPTSKRVSGKRNLYDKFLYVTDSLAPTWAMIVPSFWLGRPDHKLHKDILSKCSEVMNTTSHFPGVTGVDTCVLVKTPSTPDTIKVIDGDVVTEWPHSQVMGFVDNDVATILNKTKTDTMLDTIHFQSNEFVRSKISQGRLTPVVDITGPSTNASPVYIGSATKLVQKHQGKPRLVLNWNGSKTSIGAIKVIDRADAIISASCVALVCNSNKERDNLLGVMNSKLFRFIVRVVKTSATNNKATFRHLPLIDLTRSWTDQELYAHFNLTEEEIKLIEDTIK